MPSHKSRRGGRRGGRPRGRAGATAQGKTFSPNSVPPAFAAPRPFNAQVEFQLDVAESSFKVFTTNEISSALRAQYGLIPEAPATQSFSFNLRSVQLWLIPDANDTSFGELTVQFIDSPASGSAVLQQIKGYGSRDRAPRVGYSYPRAIRQLPIQSNSAFSWIRAKHDSRSAGDMKLLARVALQVNLFGSDA